MRRILCKSGELAPGHATATFDRAGAVIVIGTWRPPSCRQCHEPYFDGPTTGRLMELVNQVAGAKVAVREYAAA